MRGAPLQTREAAEAAHDALEDEAREEPVMNKSAGDSDTPITHDQAMESARRLINSHFRKEPCARVGIPARPGYDDDLVICQYIREQQAKNPEP